MVSQLLIAAAVSVIALPVSAATFECEFTKADDRQDLGKFVLDTATQEEVSIDAGNGLTAGCNAGRSQPDFLLCGFWNKDYEQIVTAAADLTTTIFDVNGQISGITYDLYCTRR